MPSSTARISIEMAHLEAALAVWNYCEASTRFIFNDLTGDAITDTILRELQFAGASGLGRLEISRLFNHHTPSSKVSAALMQLLTAGKVRRASYTTGARGRPTEVWFAV